MHPNPIFHTASNAENLSFARSRAFGQISVNGPDGPLVAHAPVVVAKDGKTADLHLMRSNPITRALTAPLPALFTLSGPDGYISPDWYGVPDQVPTWNYAAVHLRGSLQLLEPDELPDLLARQAAAFESRLGGKAPWVMGKVADETLDRMMRMIAPLRLTIASVDGTWKLSQNKPDAVRLGAAAELNAGFGHELDALSQMMRAIPPAK